MRASLYIVTFLLGAASLTACTPASDSQYRLLSFFFDGVPKPAGMATDGAAPGASGARAAVSSRQVIKYREHGPYAAKLCDGCHDANTNALIAPLDKLCARCHDMKPDKAYLHGPFASNDCRTCHDPHGSQYRYFLVAEPEALCFYCHDEKAVREKEVHKTEVKRCTVCHDPHMSDARYLLR